MTEGGKLSLLLITASLGDKQCLDEDNWNLGRFSLHVYAPSGVDAYTTGCDSDTSLYSKDNLLSDRFQVVGDFVRENNIWVSKFFK